MREFEILSGERGNESVSGVATPTDRVESLRAQIDAPELLFIPGSFDPLSAKLCELAGFPATFAGGFCVAATSYGIPDTGLMCFAEVLAVARQMAGAVDIPVLADGDTGFGNEINVRRTVSEYAKAGLACVMIEDQQWPKRCGHTAGKRVLEREEAIRRLKAAVDARDEGADILVLARTDARETHGLDEAVARARAFRELGADLTFIEAPRSTRELETIASEVPGPSMVNLIEGGKTPVLTRDELQSMGFAVAVAPLALLRANVLAMRSVLSQLSDGRVPISELSFPELQNLLGFDAYDRELARYS